MMDGRYIQRMQQYEDMRREADVWRLARAAGMAKYPNFGLLRSVAGRLLGWLSRSFARSEAAYIAADHAGDTGR
jgi:hypothetical protein